MMGALDFSELGASGRFRLDWAPAIVISAQQRNRKRPSRFVDFPISVRLRQGSQGPLAYLWGGLPALPYVLKHDDGWRNWHVLHP